MTRLEWHIPTLASFQHSEQQWGGHQDILTLPVAQSISRLCLCNQVCPRIKICLPRVVTANNVLSECFHHWRTKSTTSMIELASDVMHRDWDQEFMCLEPITLNIVPINEVASSPRIDKGLYRFYFSSVCGFNFDLKSERGRAVFSRSYDKT